MSERRSTKARIWPRGAAAAALLAPVMAFVPRQSPPRDLLIRRVNVIDVAGGRVLENQHVAIHAGRITSVDADQSDAPEAAVVVDARGEYLIPGLWDMHTHLVTPGAQGPREVVEYLFPLFLAHGVLGVRDMSPTALPPAPDVAWAVRTRDDIQAGRQAGPWLVVSGRVDGVDAAGAREAVRGWKNVGVDFVKVHDRLSREAYFAVLDEARRLRLPVAGHVPFPIRPHEAVDAGQVTIEHMGIGKLREAAYGYLPEGRVPPPDTDPLQTSRLRAALSAAFAGDFGAAGWTGATRRWLESPLGRGELSRLQRDLGLLESITVVRRQPEGTGMAVAVHARHARGDRHYEFRLDAAGRLDWVAAVPDVLQPQRLRELAERLVARRVWVTPTLLPLRQIAERQVLLAKPDPRLAYLPAAVRRRLDPSTDPRYRDWSDNDWAVMRRWFARDAELVNLLHRAGVRLLAGTDAAVDYCLPGFGLHEELALLVDAGLSPVEALRTATLNPAELLGALEDSGSIAAGKRADLVLLGGNPLADIRYTTAIQGVVRGGVYFDRATLDRLLADVRARAGRE
jgi:hypothetical protein